MKIFLGYPSERLSEARAVWSFLTSLGLAVWFDKESVLPGEEWRNAREKAQAAANLIIHIISPEVLIRPGEVQRELRLTLDLATEQPLGALFLIPIVVGSLPVPVEISQYQYVDFERGDWNYRVAKSLDRKFEQLGLAAPDELSNFLNTEAAAGGRIDLKIHDVTAVRDLQADYFKYRFGGRYYEFINAEIASKVLSGYYQWLRTEPPAPGDQPSSWGCQVREFFRKDQVISLHLAHSFYWTGAMHGEFGISTMNFAGENIGKFAFYELFRRNLSTLKFLIEYVHLCLKQQFKNDKGEPNFFVDFNECATDPQKGWALLDQFNFDRRGLILYFNPYEVLPFGYGTLEVRLEWSVVRDRVTDEFKRALEL